MAKSLSVSRKGDLIELGADGAYRLEPVVIRDEGVAKTPGDDGEATEWRVYAKRDTDGVLADGDGVDQPTTYSYVYDLLGSFTQDEHDEAAAIDQAKSLINAKG